jgi:DNA adenine methylase
MPMEMKCLSVLDPPYDIKDFYMGKIVRCTNDLTTISLQANVYKCPHKFMITYNVHEKLVGLYKDYYAS